MFKCLSNTDQLSDTLIFPPVSLSHTHTHTHPDSLKELTRHPPPPIHTHTHTHTLVYIFRLSFSSIMPTDVYTHLSVNVKCVCVQYKKCVCVYIDRQIDSSTLKARQIYKVKIRQHYNKRL